MRHFYSDEEIQFLTENVKGITVKELTNRFNKKFNLHVSENAISNQKTKYNLKNGLVGGQFPKGHKTWNKGTKGLTHSNKTSFKKGNIPANHKEVGYEKINTDGYIEIKIAEPNIFKLKHRYLYEQKYGEIPKGYNLIFADGNRQNLNLDNLILVSNAQLLIINQKKLYKKNKELTKSGVAVAKVLEQVNKRKKDI